MLQMENQTPDNRHLLRPLTSVSRTVGEDVPYRTPARRRFGPVGSVTRSVRQGRLTQPRSPRSPSKETNVKALLNKTWRVYRLSPLYKFKTLKSSLQQYSRSLSSHVAAEKNKGVFTDASVPGDAEVGIFSGVNVSPDDPKAVLIQIKGKSRKAVENAVIFEAVLFSTDLEYSPIPCQGQDHFVYYSVGLIRGPVLLSETVQNWLQVQFDCIVSPMTFTSHELSCMAAMFTGFDEYHKPLELVYSVPSECEGLSNISYSTKTEDCRRIWDSVRGQDKEAFTQEETTKFISALEDHFFGVFRVYLSAMPVTTIGSSIAYVGQEGKIKLSTKSTDNALRVLQHLTDLAVDRLK